MDLFKYRHVYAHIKHTQNDKRNKEETLQLAERLSLDIENLNTWVMTGRADKSNLESRSQFDQLIDQILSRTEEYKDKWVNNEIIPLICKIQDMWPEEGSYLDRYWKSEVNQIIRNITERLDKHISFIKNKHDQPKDFKMKQLEKASINLENMINQLRTQVLAAERFWHQFLIDIERTKNTYLIEKFQGLNEDVMALFQKYQVASNDTEKKHLQDRLIKLLAPQKGFLHAYVQRKRQQKADI